MVDLLLGSFLLIGLVAQPEDIIQLVHDRPVNYTLTDFEAACGTTLFRARFSNGSPRSGEVELIAIDGRPLPEAAEQLTHRIARRAIGRVGILNCGTDADQPVFQGVVEVGEIESQRRQVSPRIWFRVRREEGAWRLVLD